MSETSTHALVKWMHRKAVHFGYSQGGVVHKVFEVDSAAVFGEIPEAAVAHCTNKEERGRERGVWSEKGLRLQPGCF